MDIKQLTQGALWFSKLSSNFVFGTDSPIRTESSWEEEKDDILERANWLCEKIIVSPEQLIKEMPSQLNEEYAGHHPHCRQCGVLDHERYPATVLQEDQERAGTELVREVEHLLHQPLHLCFRLAVIARGYRAAEPVHHPHEGHGHFA